jgi:hypothetical protein
VLDAATNCGDWSSNGNEDYAWTFDPTQTVLTDMYSDSGANYAPCDELHPLICVEQ